MKAVILLVTFLALLLENVRSQGMGVELPAHLSKEEEKKLIDYSLEAFHNSTNSTRQYKVVTINKITRQFVDGAKYKLKLALAETKCPKGQDGSACPLVDPKSISKCNFTVHDRPWDKFRETKVLDCTS